MGTSRARHDWEHTRSERIERLFEAHRNATGGKPGRQWLTEELNHALISRLASEFQGFCRDLHDEAIDFLVANGGVTNQTVAKVLRTQLASGRYLDRGNATPGNLGADFAKLGLTLWPSVETAVGETNKKKWQESLDRLIKARNAIGHDDRAALIGWDRRFETLTLSGARKWRTTENNLVSALDQVLGSYLTQATGIPPW